MDVSADTDTYLMGGDLAIMSFGEEQIIVLLFLDNDVNIQQQSTCPQNCHLGSILRAGYKISADSRAVHTC